MEKINFNRADLIAHFGSWVKVQVAFYDFIFVAGLKMSPKEFREAAIKAMRGEFKDGTDFYDQQVTKMAATFETPEEAWNHFTESLGSQHHRKDDDG